MTKEDFGASSDKLKFTGSGKYKGESFDFTLPIANMKMQFKLGEKYNHDMKYDSLVFEEQPFIFDVSPDAIESSGASIDQSGLIDILTKETIALKESI